MFYTHIAALLYITVKYMDVSLHQYIFVFPQWVQFYKDPICFLDPHFNIVDCSSVYHYDTTKICRSLNSFSNILYKLIKLYLLVGVKSNKNIHKS